MFADASLRPLAIFGDTLFPEDDEASQFDLDIHAIVELADTGQIAVVNHLGSVRIFAPPRSLKPGAGDGARTSTRPAGSTLSTTSRGWSGSETAW